MSSYLYSLLFSKALTASQGKVIHQLPERGILYLLWPDSYLNNKIPADVTLGFLNLFTVIYTPNKEII